MQIDHLEEFIQLDELSDEKFSIKESVQKANEILENLNKNYDFFNRKFEENKWTFEVRFGKGQTVNFDFSELENTTRFNENWGPSSVILVKCWVAELLSEFYPESVRLKYGLLVKILVQTNFFSKDKSVEFIESLRNFTPATKKCLEDKGMGLKNLEEELKKDRQGLAILSEIVNTALNFLTYCELTTFHTYHKPLIDIKKGLPSTKFVRLLPKGKDVLTLDYCIEKYFSIGFNCQSRLYFAPILLWWKLTNIIPTRICEFCSIKRACLSIVDGKYYITLPREKNSAKQRYIQVIDTLEITKEIYELIENYRQLTAPLGESKTLISFRAILALEEKNTSRRMKVDWNYFSKHNFRVLLQRFYREVVYGEYNLSVEREVRPNDTRHFAFCSLLMQGISPIEIARLGGHSTIEAQYHYSNHTEYFIDIEVKKLIDGFKRKDGKIKGTTFEGNEITFEDIERKSFQFPSKENKTRLPMEIGFCTDKLQNCESEECMLCSHWWIHPEDLVKARPLIEKKIRERKQKIIEMGNFLKNLNESLNTEMLIQNEVHPNIYTKMKTEASSIHEHLVEIARLEILKGDNGDE